MPDLEDGESTQVKGSGSALYTLKNTGGVYSCTCPAWAHQSIGIERRTCKHLRALRGDDAEKERLGTAELAGKPARPPRAPGEASDSADAGSEPPVLLAHKWETDVDLTGWWMSEKLDGVRAYWDGTRFLSRLGNAFYPPDWFTAALPATPLDGELWGGRKKFQRTVGIVKRQDKSELWRDITYVVFDTPSHEGTFEERMAHAEAIAAGRAAHMTVLRHERCRDYVHLKEELARVEALGGEGLMMRKPGSKYEVGRSHTLLKVKSFHDAEARVLEHVAGMGRHKGRLGAVLAELPDGTRFNIGTGFSDAERKAPPPIGAIVTFRYQELSEAGVPRFPSYVGVRDDFKWPGRTSPAPKAAPAPAPKTVAKKPKVASSGGAGGGRYFELVDDSSSKFWEITLEGKSFTTRYGRIGQGGQSTCKEFGSEAKAKTEHDKLVAEKVKKGYEETSG